MACMEKTSQVQSGKAQIVRLNVVSMVGWETDSKPAWLWSVGQEASSGDKGSLQAQVCLALI